MSAPTVTSETSTAPAPHGFGDADAEFDLDISIFESGIGLDEIIRMTDDNCGSTCQSACNSC